MDKFLGQEQPEEDRWQFIQDNADAIEEIGYTHRFTPEELAQKKESLAETSIEINDIEEEKKEVMQEYKKQLEPLVSKKKQLLEHIKKGSEFRENEQCPKSFITTKGWLDITTNSESWFIPALLCHKKCKKQFSKI